MGYDPVELIGKSFLDLDLLTRQSLRLAIFDAMRVLRGKHIISKEYEFIAKDGTIKIVDTISKKEMDLALPYSEASAFIGYKDSMYVGLKNGCILKLEYK